MTSSQMPAESEPGTAAQQDRRRRILDATVELASEGGFDAVQMRAVADRASVALGTLYRYFPSKVHLLVTALARELERANDAFERKPLAAPTAQDRVLHVLNRITRSLRKEPSLTEALTRAFMFADASASAETRAVVAQVHRMLLRAMRDPAAEAPSEPTGEQRAVAQVIGDVWLATLVQWVTGRATAADVGRSLEVAVGLLLRPSADR
ncbi:MAG TPA: TetR family transcriptional regulator [Nocardioidaceae bacterium]|nr:TetR family transcriptional regulator [Nocardioidaceae bacterium]